MNSLYYAENTFSLCSLWCLWAEQSWTILILVVPYFSGYTFTGGTHLNLTSSTFKGLLTGPVLLFACSARSIQGHQRQPSLTFWAWVSSSLPWWSSSGQGLALRFRWYRYRSSISQKLPCHWSSDRRSFVFHPSAAGSALSPASHALALPWLQLRPRTSWSHGSPSHFGKCWQTQSASCQSVHLASFWLGATSTLSFSW